MISFGPAYKASKIQDFGDPANDFIYGEALNVEVPPYGNGGKSTDCATALTDPKRRLSSHHVRLFACRPADGHRLHHAGRLQSELRPSHDRGGRVVRSRTDIEDTTRSALQAGPISWQPILTPNMPGAQATVVDNAPNLGNTYQSYVQDSWRMSDLYEADYGLRYDFFTVGRPGFPKASGGFSPRLKTHALLRETCEHLCVHRSILRTVLSERQPVGGVSAQPPAAAGRRQFRSEAGTRHAARVRRPFPVGSGDLGFRIWQKNANDLIDDTQVGVTLLHQDINYVLGRLSQEAINYVQPLARNGRLYFSAAHVVSDNSGCETQLLAPCFGGPDRLYAGRPRAELEHRERRAAQQSSRRLVFRRRRIRPAACPQRSAPTTPPAIASARPIPRSTSKKASQSPRRPH